MGLFLLTITGGNILVSLMAGIESLEPYRRIVPELPAELRLDELSLEGRLTFRGDRVTYEGHVQTGAGAWGDESWESLEGRVSRPRHTVRRSRFVSRVRAARANEPNAAAKSVATAGVIDSPTMPRAPDTDSMRGNDDWSGMRCVIIAICSS